MTAKRNPGIGEARKVWDSSLRGPGLVRGRLPPAPFVQLEPNPPMHALSLAGTACSVELGPQKLPTFY